MKYYLQFALIFLFPTTFAYSIIPPGSFLQKDPAVFPADTLLARIFINKSDEFLKELKYDSAIVYLDNAKIIYENENLWENYFDCVNTLASILRELDDVDSSVAVLENVLPQEEEKLGEDNLTYAKTKNLLGYSYMIKSNYEKAFGYAKESLRIQLKNKNYEESADTYYLLGIIYFQNGQFDSSLVNLNTALNNCKKENQKILLSNIYNTFGQVYSSKKSSDKAIEYYKLSLKIKLKELGEINPETSVIYNNIAVEYFYKEDNDAALEYYLKALAIDKQIKEPDDYILGLRYNNLAMAFRVKGDFEQALKYGELSKNILVKQLGEKHPNVGAIINNTGRIYADMKEYDKAIGLYQTALNIWIEKFGEEHPLVAQGFANYNPPPSFGNFAAKFWKCCHCQM